MPPAPPSDEPSFAVGHDGKIDGIYRPGDQPGRGPQTIERASSWPRRATRPLHPESPEPRRQQASRRKTIFALSIIGAGLVLPLGARWVVQLLKERGPAQTQGLIIIDSVPSNARVFIDGVEVGRTPYVELNTFSPGSVVPTRIVYPSAQDWSCTFPGGVSTTLTAELQPK